VKLGKELRFPKVTDHLRSPADAVARLAISAVDAQFLSQSLPRLPGNDDTYRAITLDMNGQIAIRARGEDQHQPTELLLTQSAWSGDPLRISTDRRYFARALRRACATPSGLAIGGGIGHPGCADVPRPWAAMWNAFGVEERASVSEIPTYVEALMTAVREQPVVRPSTSPAQK